MMKYSPGIGRLLIRIDYEHKVAFDIALSTLHEHEVIEVVGVVEAVGCSVSVPDIPMSAATISVIREMNGLADDGFDYQPGDKVLVPYGDMLEAFRDGEYAIVKRKSVVGVNRNGYWIGVNGYYIGVSVDQDDILDSKYICYIKPVKCYVDDFVDRNLIKVNEGYICGKLMPEKTLQPMDLS